jgi:hypothetical protein
MRGRISVSAKPLGVALLALVVVVFIWDEITAHPWGPLLYYCVETGDGCNRGWVAVNSPDTETYFDGKEGYAWEIKPISISGSQAVIDFRVKHFDHFAPAADMDAQLEQSEFRRLIVRPEQPLTIEAPDGAKLSLTGSVY